jgi:hypothetical protein
MQRLERVFGALSAISAVHAPLAAGSETSVLAPHVTEFNDKTNISFIDSRADVRTSKGAKKGDGEEEKKKQSFGAARNGVTYIVGLDYVHHSAMMSYPNYNGLNKALDHPDIHLLAALAELAGVDFRVIVLQRNAREVLASTARRGFGGHEEPRILATNAAVLAAQLQSLHRSFYQCAQYSELAHLDAQQQTRLASFIHADMSSDVVLKMLSKITYSNSSASVHSTRSSSSSSSGGGAETTALRSAAGPVPVPEQAQQGKYPIGDLQVWQLQQPLQLIDAFCNGLL